VTGRLIAAGASIVAVIASGVAAAPAADVTMNARRIYDVACRCYTLRFSGAISSRAANEYVAIMLQRCGYRFSTAVTGVQTRAGGLWEVEWSGGDRMSGTYRAQWNGHLSEPVTVRPRVPLVFAKLRRQRYRVTVNMYETLQDMSGRLVELQRLAAGGWTRVRRTRLATDRESFGKSFSATFAVPTRGLTLRVLVPRKSAAPCYIAGVTKTWVS
jgi:hypothetical protein